MTASAERSAWCAHHGVPDGVGYGRRAAGRSSGSCCRSTSRRPRVGNGITIGLEADTRAAVDAAYAAGMAAGGKDEGKPGLRTHYHPNYYGAYRPRSRTATRSRIVCHKPA